MIYARSLQLLRSEVCGYEDVTVFHIYAPVTAEQKKILLLSQYTSLAFSSRIVEGMSGILQFDSLKLDADAIGLWAKEPKEIEAILARLQFSSRALFNGLGFPGLNNKKTSQYVISGVLFVGAPGNLSWHFFKGLLGDFDSKKYFLCLIVYSIRMNKIRWFYPYKLTIYLTNNSRVFWETSCVQHRGKLPSFPICQQGCFPTFLASTKVAAKRKQKVYYSLCRVAGKRN